MSLRGTSSAAVLLCLFAFAPDDGQPPPRAPKAMPVEAAGLHNVFRLTERLYSGSGPEGDEGYAALAKLGVKTVISVDGARSDVERARKHGLRYVHLPVGYDGVPQAQAVRLAKAVRDLPGPIYLHCHHGKHRGPAAAATVLLSLDATCPVEAATAFLKQAGTDPRYRGLYAAPLQLRRPSREELDGLAADFPETAKVAALAKVMVAIDVHFANLEQVRKAGWKPPAAHPDLDPPHEALQLVEQYREAARLPEVAKKYPKEFRRWLKDAEAAAVEIEQALRRRPTDKAIDGAAADKLLHRAAMACTRCHARYRDEPRPR